jgi:hypothetical protein
LAIDATNYPALVGDVRRTGKYPRNKIWKLKTLQILTPPIASLRQYFGAAQVYPSLILQHISLLSMKTNNSLRFALFIRTLPIDFSLLGWKRKYVKSKTTAKLKGKLTLIATI